MGRKGHIGLWIFFPSVCLTNHSWPCRWPKSWPGHYYLKLLNSEMKTVMAYNINPKTSSLIVKRILIALSASHSLWKRTTAVSGAVISANLTSPHSLNFSRINCQVTVGGSCNQNIFVLKTAQLLLHVPSSVVFLENVFINVIKRKLYYIFIFMCMWFQKLY